MAVEINSCVQNLTGIDDRGQCPDRIHIMDEFSAVVSGESAVQNEVVDDLVETRLQAVLIPADQFFHVRGHRQGRIHRTRLQGRVRLVEIGDQAVTQNDPDPWSSLDFERSELKDLRHVFRNALGEERAGNEESYRQSER